jgi:hypothetical protein
MRTDVWPAGPAAMVAGDSDGSAEPTAGLPDVGEAPGLDPGFAGLAEHAAASNPTMITVASRRLLQVDLLDIGLSPLRGD